ncbi:hypothetical protein AAG906_006805 [Vitis piasezkii]
MSMFSNIACRAHQCLHDAHLQDLRKRATDYEAKIAIRDLQFGGLLNLNRMQVRHNLCIFLIQHFNVGFRQIEFSARNTICYATDVGLILASQRRMEFAVTSTSSDHPFGTIRACEEKLLDLPLHYVIKFQIPSVQVPITVPRALAWTDDLIKRRLVAEIKEFGAFGHRD